MPIRGLTTNTQPRFPSLGILRKGDAAPKDAKGAITRPGQELAHFRFVSERPEVAKAFADAYGEQPTLVNVFLPYRTVDENFQTWKEIWSAGGLQHRCDGETMVRWRGADGNLHDDPKPCPYASVPNPGRDACTPIGRLACIVPELVRAGFVGFVTIQTGSINDIANMHASLTQAAELSRGDLRGIYFTVRRQKQAISTPGKEGKRVRRPKVMIQIEPAVEWARVQMAMYENVALGQQPEPRALPAPADATTGEIPMTDEERAALAEEAEFVAMNDDPMLDPDEAEPPEEPPAEEPGEFLEQARKDAVDRIERAVKAKGRAIDTKFKAYFQQQCGITWEQATLDTLNTFAESLTAKRAS